MSKIKIPDSDSEKESDSGKELERSHSRDCKGPLEGGSQPLEEAVEVIVRVFFPDGEMKVNCTYFSEYGTCLCSKGGLKECPYKT